MRSNLRYEIEFIESNITVYSTYLSLVSKGFYGVYYCLFYKKNYMKYQKYAVSGQIV